MREKYESLALAQLRELAKVRGIKGAATMKKSEVVEAMLAEDEKDKAKKAKETRIKAEEKATKLYSFCNFEVYGIYFFLPLEPLKYIFPW